MREDSLQLLFLNLTLQCVFACAPLIIQQQSHVLLTGVFISSILGETRIEPFHLETILYQLTMPGLAEEITYRGIFLAILNRYLGKPWKIAGTRFGWGIILITLLFVIAHFYYYNSKTHQVVWAISNYTDVSIAMALLIGILLGVDP